jgi:hypothetical protein
MNEHMASALLGVSTDIWIRDMQHDTQRTARRLAELGGLFSTGAKQRRFFQQAEDILKNRSSAYYALLKTLCTRVDVGALRTFGMAFGYHSLSRGAAKRRAAVQAGHKHVSFASFVREATAESLEDSVASLYPLGTGTFIVYPSNDGDATALCGVMRKYRDCAFLVFDAKHAFADDLPFNAMRLIPFQEVLSDDFSGKCELFGAFAAYHDASVDCDTSAERLRALSDCGCMFYVLTAASGVSSCVQTQVSRRIATLRRNLPCPIFPVSLETDVQYVDSPVARFLPQFAGVL